MDIFYTIIPIFAVIILGWVVRLRGFLPPEFLGPANRLVYHFAIPAMIFNAITKTSFQQQFNPLVIGIMLLAVTGTFGIAWLGTRVLRIPRRQRGTFVQCAAHGNLGYVGLAVAYYYLGEGGLTRASVAAGFLMIVQNLLSVIALQTSADSGRPMTLKSNVVVKIMGNPVILAAMVGILFSFMELGLPLVLRRSLDILSGMALPTALLLIGATLSFDLIYRYIKLVLSAASIKLALLPLLGLGLFRIFEIPAADYMPALILLASPTATISYVMAKEMGGDSNAAVATISAVTLISALTFTFWLHQGA